MCARAAGRAPPFLKAHAAPGTPCMAPAQIHLLSVGADSRQRSGLHRTAAQAGIPPTPFPTLTPGNLYLIVFAKSEPPAVSHRRSFLNVREQRRGGRRAAASAEPAAWAAAFLLVAAKPGRPPKPHLPHLACPSPPWPLPHVSASARCPFCRALIYFFVSTHQRGGAGKQEP